MGKILRRYAIREILLPTLMALLTITFILLIQYVYQLINLLMQEGVGLMEVGGVLMSVLPSILVFATPMAVLIGVLIGVGRMTLDREVLAIRASGINLLAVFIPALALLLALSGLVFWLTSGPVPAMMSLALTNINQLELKLVNSLEPGRFYEDLASDDLVFYFNERDPKTNAMRGVTLEMEKDVAPPSLSLPPGADPEMFYRKAELTLIFAETGTITASETGSAEEGNLESAITLTLSNGSVHQLEVGPEPRDYVRIHFDGLQKQLFQRSEIEKRHHTLSNAELKARYLAAPDNKNAGTLVKELWQRRSMWLATFIFGLLGIPLAIWVRPSGKSWGILIAVGLMLAYYVLLQMGLTMVQEFKPSGVAVALLPNLLFGLLGALLWWQTLRS